MLLWLMNMGFAGGGAVEVETIEYRKIQRRIQHVEPIRS